jgi:hypothetical protein
MAISLTILLVGMGTVAIRKMALPSNLFVCRNPECGMRTCLGCDREVCAGGPRRGNGGADVLYGMCTACMQDHSPVPCNDPSNLLLEGTMDGLRLYIEQQMARALVRTCPRCACQFCKSEGTYQELDVLQCICGMLAAHAHVVPHCRLDPTQAATR